MSESDKIRPDPATLRWVANVLTEAWGVTADDGIAIGVRRGLSRIVKAVSDCANEFAVLPPRLSDWVRACEGTALGQPNWAVQTAPASRHALLARYGPDDEPTPDWPCVEVLDWMDDGDERLRGVEAVTAIVWCDGRSTPCLTPAELTGVLDRIAEAGR